MKSDCRNQYFCIAKPRGYSVC